MAELTIRLERDPDTERQLLTVALAPDPEELPHEHEPRHRNLVARVLAPGVFVAALAAGEEEGRLRVERQRSGRDFVPC